MKKITFITLSLALVAGLALLSSCKGKTTAAAAPQEAAETEETEVLAESCLKAIDTYLASELGPTYAKGEYCIPCGTVVACDESDPEHVRVWGDFWVFNYNKVDDVLETVSGGNHPGMMHIDKTDNGYEVTAFDQVADGHDFAASAQEIFGECYDAFQAAASNEEAREEVRRKAIAAFVEKENIPVSQYKDYGWPARQINQ